MKKKILSILLVIVLSIAFVYMAVGCVNRSFKNAEQVEYFEYTDLNEKIYFRGMSWTAMYGHIVLGGEKIPAKFEFSVEFVLLIFILEEYAPEGYRCTEEYYDDTLAWDILSLRDLDKNDQLVGTNEEVELFGEKFERIVLTLNRLDADDFDAWEYGTRWKSNTSDDNTVLNFYSRTPIWWNTDKCVLISVKKSADEQEEYYIFKWLPEEKGFEIYVRENDEQYVPQEGQEPVSTGTYEKKGEKFNETVTLTFTTDGLFDGKYPTLELVRKY